MSTKAKWHYKIYRVNKHQVIPYYLANKYDSVPIIKYAQYILTFITTTEKK